VEPGGVVVTGAGDDELLGCCTDGVADGDDDEQPAVSATSAMTVAANERFPIPMGSRVPRPLAGRQRNRAESQ
jgi:hypothetical protein